MKCVIVDGHYFVQFIMKYNNERYKRGIIIGKAAVIKYLFDQDDT